MSSYELEVRAGKETVTIRNNDGSIQSITERTVTAETWQEEAYNRLHTGICSVCLVKGKPVNMYNVCEDCDTATADYGLASINLASLFNHFHENEIYEYTSKILKAKKPEDKQGYAKELVGFCLSKGIAGRAYIEDFIPRMTKPTKYNTSMEQAYRTAFSWWTKEK